MDFIVVREQGLSIVKGRSPAAAAPRRRAALRKLPLPAARPVAEAKPYSILAPYYDILLGHFRKPFEDARDTVMRSRFPHRTGAYCDLACGTGNSCVQLAFRGWRSQGVDKAPAMIACSEDKRDRIRNAPPSVLSWLASGDLQRLKRQAPAAAHAKLLRPLNLQFHCADMRDFTLSEPVDFMTCLFDSLNHLPHRRDLAPAMAAAARNLKPGGLFLFDINSLQAVREIWPNMNPELHRNDHAGYWAMVQGGPFDPQHCRSSVRWTWYLRQTPGETPVPASAVTTAAGAMANPPVAVAHLPHEPHLSADGMFVPPTGTGWKKIEEEYFETGWTTAQIKSAVQKAGLKMLWFVDANELTAGFEAGWRYFGLAERTRA